MFFLRRHMIDDRSHALRGNATWDATRPAFCNDLHLRTGDAERHEMHYHAERGNDHSYVFALINIGAGSK